MQVGCLLLALAAVASGANPDAPRREGIKKLNQAVDCTGVVAFSAVAAPKGKINKNSVVNFDTALIDKSVGYSRESGIFTAHCPGLYQFSFTGTCDDCKFSLRKRPSSDTSSWSTLVVTGKTGGSHVVFLDMEVGEQTAIFLESGSPSQTPSHTFSGLRVSKK